MLAATGFFNIAAPAAAVYKAQLLNRLLHPPTGTALLSTLGRGGRRSLLAYVVENAYSTTTQYPQPLMMQPTSVVVNVTTAIPKNNGIPVTLAAPATQLCHVTGATLLVGLSDLDVATKSDTVTVALNGATLVTAWSIPSTTGKYYARLAASDVKAIVSYLCP